MDALPARAGAAARTAPSATAPPATLMTSATPATTATVSPAVSPAVSPGARVPAARRPARTRSAPRPVPQMSEDYRHLGLAELRAYRSGLQDEEGRVSYWRRILQARLDVVRQGRRLGGTEALDPAALRPVLSGERVGAGRTALLEVLPVDDVPPLPDLGDLWERQVAPDDDAGLTALEADLTAAEEQLSVYRSTLHTRLAEATDELIARYRQSPVLCLDSLPLPAGTRRRA